MFNFNEVKLQPKNTEVSNVLQDDYVFIFKDHAILLGVTHEIMQGCDPQLDIFPAKYYWFATLNNRRCLLLDEPANLTNESDLSWVQLKSLCTLWPGDLFAAASLAHHMHDWRRHAKFCGACGGVTHNSPEERALICASCQHVYYPRIAPCVIVLITKGEQILLARSPHFSQEMYSVLAGFVEPGESIEQAVHREVYEETQIKINNLRYVCSQPWPFPNSLMLGFYADYMAGSIQVDGKEISDAQWFDRNDLPLIPAEMSISRYLIDHASF